MMPSRVWPYGGYVSMLWWRLLDNLMHKRPLENIRVIDFGQYIAGPAVAMMLADQGAEVIRVDPPSGPAWDNPANAILNRNKKSIVLDLKSPDDLDVALMLIDSADVVVENFRPGVMDRLGLGAKAMTNRNKRLVYLSLPGFAHNDPQWSQMQAWEGIIGGAVGQFKDMGLNRVLMGINPSFSPLTLASGYGASLASMSAVLALFARETTGLGDMIEVPLAAAMMEGLVYNSMHFDNLPERYLSRREREIARRERENIPMDMTYPELRSFLDPLYQSYICADGRPFYVVCASHTAHSKKTFEVLGIWDEVERANIPMDDPYSPAATWKEGCTLWAYPFTEPWAAFLTEKMEAAFLTKTAFEWEQLFGEAMLPGAAHRYTREWIHSDHALESGLILEVEDPIYGPMRQAGNVGWLKSDAQYVVRKQPAPILDADRESILSSLGHSLDNQKQSAREDMDSAKSTKTRTGWLEGVKVLDLTNVIAGPTIASTLARFGAEIIKLDNTRPTFDPWNTVIFGLQANRGKRSILADIKTPKGREIIHKLIAQADVLNVNAVDQQLARLGLTPKQIREINPNIVICQIDAYGGPMTGPRSGYVGFDDTVQASTGIMSRFGGSMDTPEEHAHLGTIDVLGGFCGAFALGVALLKRARTGEGDVARASLSGAGQLLQLPFMYDYATRGPFDEPAGREVKGAHAHYHCYEASDGWLFLGMKPERSVELANIPEFANIETIEAENKVAFFQQQFKTQPMAYWLETISRMGLGICAIHSMADLREANLVSEAQSRIDFEGKTMEFIRHHHPGLGKTVDIFSPCAVRPSHGAARIPDHAPKYGQHTREILEEVGYTNLEIDALIHDQVVSESWCDDYLPD